MNETILATLIEAIAKYKEDIDEINSILDLLPDEIKATQTELQKTKDTLNQRIEDIVMNQ